MGEIYFYKLFLRYAGSARKRKVIILGAGGRTDAAAAALQAEAFGCFGSE